MFVYGVRCAPDDLIGLPDGAVADYYLDYGLLVFPEYTQSSTLHAHGRTTPHFWNAVAKMVSGRVHVVDREQPWITDGEDAVVQCLRERYPALQPEWYYVSRAATPGSAPPSEDD